MTEVWHLGTRQNWYKHPLHAVLEPQDLLLHSEDTSCPSLTAQAPL